MDSGRGVAAMRLVATRALLVSIVVCNDMLKGCKVEKSQVEGGNMIIFLLTARGHSLSSKHRDRSTSFYDVARRFSTNLQHQTDAKGAGAGGVTANNIQRVSKTVLTRRLTPTWPRRVVRKAP
jgi:hypothetical protein